MEAIRNCCHAAYTYPVSREKFIVIGCGLVCSIVFVVLLVAVCSSGDDNNIKIVGREVLKHAPLIISHNELVQNLKDIANNHLKNFSFQDISTNTGKWKNCTKCRTDLTRLKAGMVSSQVWSVTSDCVSSFKDSVSLVLEQIDVIKRLIDFYSDYTYLVMSSSGIRGLFNFKLSSLIAIDGGHTIDGRLAVLRTYYNLGVRILSLGNDCKKDTQRIPWFNETGLTNFGKMVVQEMNRLGMIIDISKLPSKVQIDVMDNSKAPVIIRNCNAYNRSASDDNIKDEVLRYLKEKNGLIMVSFNPDLIAKDTKNVTLADLVNQISYLRSMLGTQHIGIGGGFDGFEGEVFQLEDSSKFPVLFDALYENENKQNSWTMHELKGLAGNNFLTIMEAVEKMAQELQKNYPNDDYEPLDEIPEAIRDVCYTDFKQRYPDNEKLHN